MFRTTTFWTSFVLIERERERELRIISGRLGVSTNGRRRHFGVQRERERTTTWAARRLEDIDDDAIEEEDDFVSKEEEGKRDNNRRCFPSVPGLAYLPNVLDAATHDAVVGFVEEQLQLGRANKLKGSTYAPIPPKWDRRLQGREMLQYGTYTHSNRVYDKDEVDVETMPKILKDRVVQRLVERGVFDEDAFLPDSCTINVYRKGQWLPPHVDNPHFKRPFCTVSLVADETCIFGKGIVWHPGLDESRSTSESRSAVKEENWQDVTKTFEGEACRSCARKIQP